MNGINRSSPGNAATVRKGQTVKLIYAVGQKGLELSSMVDDRPFPVARTATLFPVLESITTLPGANLAATHTTIKVPSSRGLEIRDILKEASAIRSRSLLIHIDPIILALVGGECPADFHLDYHWMAAAGRLKRALSSATHYLGDGYFIQNHTLFPLPGFIPPDDAWLSKEEIAGRDVLPFLSEVFPRWKSRHTPVRTDAPFYPEPVLDIQITGLDKQMLALNIRWLTPADTLRPILEVDQLVAEGSRMRPGVAPDLLTRWLPTQEGECLLSGERIMTFMQEAYPLIKPFIEHRTQELEDMHRLIEGSCDLALSIRTESRRGVGKTYAEPCILYPGGQTRALEVSREWLPHSRYTRVQEGWVRTWAISRTGIDAHGRLSDGTPVSKRLALVPAEIFLRGGERLNGPWSRIVGPALDWMTGPGLPGWAQSHLESLRRIGVNGGVVAPFNSVRGEVKGFAQQYRREAPDGMMLVVGLPALLSALAAEWADLDPLLYTGSRIDPIFPRRMGGVIMATPHALEEYPELLGIPWDIALILNPASLPLDQEGFVKRCETLSARLRIGAFNQDEFLYNDRLLQLYNRIFAVSQPDMHWRWALRYADRDWQLPQPLALQKRALNDAGWEAIPTGRKAAQLGGETGSPLSLTGELLRLSAEEQFVYTAAKLSALPAEDAPYVSFTQPAPDFRDMSDEQLRFYASFRSRIRAGAYVEADMPYVLIYVYELLNGIGWSHPENGLAALCSVFRMQRGQWPALDEILPTWILDFMKVHNVSSDEAYALIGEASPESNVDILLTYYEDTPSLKINARMLGVMTDMVDDRVLRNPILGQHIARLVEGLDWAFRRDRSQGLLRLFGRPGERVSTRQAYDGALYAGVAPDVRIQYTPHSRNGKLRSFLTHVGNYAGGEMLYRLGLDGVRVEAGDQTLKRLVDRYLDMHLKQEDIMAQDNWQLGMEQSMESLQWTQADIQFDEDVQAALESLSSPGRSGRKAAAQGYENLSFSEYLQTTDTPALPIAPALPEETAAPLPPAPPVQAAPPLPTAQALPVSPAPPIPTASVATQIVLSDTPPVVQAPPSEPAELQPVPVEVPVAQPVKNRMRITGNAATPAVPVVRSKPSIQDEQYIQTAETNQAASTLAAQRKDGIAALSKQASLSEPEPPAVPQTPLTIAPQPPANQEAPSMSTQATQVVAPPVQVAPTPAQVVPSPAPAPVPPAQVTPTPAQVVASPAPAPVPPVQVTPAPAQAVASPAPAVAPPAPAEHSVTIPIQPAPASPPASAASAQSNPFADTQPGQESTIQFTATPAPAPVVANSEPADFGQDNQDFGSLFGSESVVSVPFEHAAAPSSSSHDFSDFGESAFSENLFQEADFSSNMLFDDLDTDRNSGSAGSFMSMTQKGEQSYQTVQPSSTAPESGLWERNATQPAPAGAPLHPYETTVPFDAAPVAPERPPQEETSFAPNTYEVNEAGERVFTIQLDWDTSLPAAEPAQQGPAMQEVLINPSTPRRRLVPLNQQRGNAGAQQTPAPDTSDTQEDTYGFGEEAPSSAAMGSDYGSDGFSDASLSSTPPDPFSAPPTPDAGNLSHPMGERGFEAEGFGEPASMKDPFAPPSEAFSPPHEDRFDSPSEGFGQAPPIAQDAYMAGFSPEENAVPVEAPNDDVWSQWLTGDPAPIPSLDAHADGESWNELPPIEQFMGVLPEAESIAPAPKPAMDDAALLNVLRQLTDPQAALLWHLRRFGWEAPSTTIQQALTAYPLETLVDSINDQVYTHLDDLLIEEMSDLLSVVSTYRKSVSAMLDERVSGTTK